MKEHNTPEKNYDLERLIFFSDGVFAIAITLLVIEMHPPEGWDGTLDALIQAIAAKLIFYVVSFFSLGMFWMAHRFIFRHVQKFNEIVSFLNLMFLCLICLMPFVNAMTSEYGLATVVFGMYLGLMGALSLFLGLLWAYASLIANLTDPRMTAAFKWLSLLRVCFSPIILGGTSLWIGYRYGVIPSVAFAVVGGVLSSRLKFKPYAADKASESAPQAISDAPK